MEEFAGEPIPSEDALWELLDRLVENPDDAVGPIQISGWTPQLLYFPEEEISHSVRPTLARAITEFHASLSKAYALAVYGQPNRLLLKRDDREALDLIFVVTDGSNGLETVGEAINRLTVTLADKLTGRQVVVVIVVLLLLYFGSSTIKDWYASVLDHKAEQIVSEERIALSVQETERMRLLSEAMEQFGVDPLLMKQAEDGITALTRPATQENRTRVRGIDLTKHQARVILSGEEKEREGHRLDGDYRVLEINTETATGFTVRLQDIETGQEFNALASYAELARDDIHTIFEVAEAKAELHAQVNVFFVGDKITSAYIVRAYIEPDETDAPTDEGKSGEYE